MVAAIAAPMPHVQGAIEKFGPSNALNALFGIGVSRLAGAILGYAEGALAPEASTAVSTIRETVEGESFSHYSTAGHAESLSGGLRPGSFATPVSGLSGEAAQSGLALPHAAAPDAVYTVTPRPGTLIRVNPTTAAANGRPGGLPEVEFLLGTGRGTVSGPTPIAP